MHGGLVALTNEGVAVFVSLESRTAWLNTMPRDALGSGACFRHFRGRAEETGVCADAVTYAVLPHDAWNSKAGRRREAIPFHHTRHQDD